VSVAAASCVDANVAATAAVVLGEDAPAWLEERRLPARAVRRDGSIVVTGGWPEEVRAA
jgi:thiamine biosynthesis lipoprotein